MHLNLQSSCSIRHESSGFSNVDAVKQLKFIMSTYYEVHYNKYLSSFQIKVIDYKLQPCRISLGFPLGDDIAVTNSVGDCFAPPNVSFRNPGPASSI